MKKIAFILMFIANSALAGELEIVKNFQNWSVIRASDGKDLIAVTFNESNNFIGFRCSSSTKQCIHVLSANTACEDGGSYPILVNSDFSSMSMNSICSISGINHELILTPYDSIHIILQKGSNIGFAIPMESGQFKVVRFSLLGSEDAMNYVEQKTSEMKTSEEYL